MWQIDAHGMYMVGRDELLQTDSPTTDDLLRSWLSPVGVFSYPATPSGMRGAPLEAKVLEYMRALHLVLRHATVAPGECVDLSNVPMKMRKRTCYGVSQLRATASAQKLDMRAAQGAH